MAAATDAATTTKTTQSSFPRVSPCGVLILAVYLSFTKAAFDASHYEASLRSRLLADYSFVALNGGVAATSLLNAASHAAVVLGALDDTYVLSILVGVGFDVAARFLYLVWWAQLSFVVAFFDEHGPKTKNAGDEYDNDDTSTDRCARTVFFLAVLGAVYGRQILVHVRALRMNESSYDGLLGVLRSALNNLRGVPGDWYGDHVFAYSDLGGHLAPLWLSLRLLKQQQALACGFWIFACLVLASGVILSRVPLDGDEGHGSEESFVRLKEGNVECSCGPCKRMTQLTGEHSSFTFNWRGGVCRLWLCSFEELYNILSGLTDTKILKKIQ